MRKNNVLKMMLCIVMLCVVSAFAASASAAAVSAGASAVAAARAELSAEACASYATSPMVPKEMFAT